MLSATLYSIGGADIAMAPDGSSVLLTTGVRVDTGLDEATARRRSAGAGGTVFSSEGLYTPTNTTGNVNSPRVEIDQQGTVLAAFIDSPTTTGADSFNRELRAAQATPDTPFEDADVIATRGTDVSIEMGDVAISNGHSIVGYERNIGAGRATLLTSYRAAGATDFATPQTLDGSPTDPAQAASGLDLAMFPDGEAMVGYNIEIANTRIARVAFRKKTGIQANQWSGYNRVDNFGPADTARVGVDDSGRGVIQWTEHRGANDNEVWAQSTNQSGTDGALNKLGEGDIPETQLSVSPSGQAVSVWTRTNTEASLVAQASFGAPPGAPPPPVDTTATADRRRSRRARSSWPAPSHSGKATVLTVSASSAATRIEWKVDGSPTVIAPGSLRSIRFRPDRSFSATARVIAPGGNRTTTRTFRGPAVPDDSDAKKVYRRVQESGAGVYAAGNASVLMGGTSYCGATWIYASRQTTSGCFRPVEALGDIPSAEQGVLARLAEAFALNAADTGLMRRAVELTEGYVGSGAAFLANAWPMYPNGSAKIVVYPQASTLLSSNAAIRVGGQSIKPAGGGFNLRLNPSQPRHPARERAAAARVLGGRRLPLHRRLQRQPSRGPRCQLQRVHEHPRPGADEHAAAFLHQPQRRAGHHPAGLPPHPVHAEHGRPLDQLGGDVPGHPPDQELQLHVQPGRGRVARPGRCLRVQHHLPGDGASGRRAHDQERQDRPCQDQPQLRLARPAAHPWIVPRERHARPGLRPHAPVRSTCA